MHKIIAVEAREMQERLQKQQQQQQQILEEQKKAAMEMEAYRAELKLDADLMRIREQRISNKEQAEIQAQSLANQYDIDKNQENDLIQRQREQQAFEAEQKQLDRDHDLKVVRLKESKSKAQ